MQHSEKFNRQTGVFHLFETEGKPEALYRRTEETGDFIQTNRGFHTFGTAGHRGFQQTKEYYKVQWPDQLPDNSAPTPIQRVLPDKQGFLICWNWRELGTFENICKINTRTKTYPFMHDPSRTKTSRQQIRLSNNDRKININLLWNYPTRRLAETSSNHIIVVLNTTPVDSASCYILIA